MAKDRPFSRSPETPLESNFRRQPAPRAAVCRCYPACSAAMVKPVVLRQHEPTLRVAKPRHRLRRAAAVLRPTAFWAACLETRHRPPQKPLARRRPRARMPPTSTGRAFRIIKPVRQTPAAQSELRFEIRVRVSREFRPAHRFPTQPRHRDWRQPPVHDPDRHPARRPRCPNLPHWLPHRPVVDPSPRPSSSGPPRKTKLRFCHRCPAAVARDDAMSRRWMPRKSQQLNRLLSTKRNWSHASHGAPSIRLLRRRKSLRKPRRRPLRNRPHRQTRVPKSLV